MQAEKEKLIAKRRLVALKKQYLMKNSQGQFDWISIDPQDKQLTKKSKEYDEQYKNQLPYFPCVFEISNKKIKIQFEDKVLKVFYNDEHVTSDTIPEIKIRRQILRQLDALFPIQLYDQIYNQSKQKKKAKELVDKKEY